MNKLKIVICAVFTLLLVNTTAQADSSNFAGPYVGVTASGYGIQLDGTARTSMVDTVGQEIDEVSIGQVAPVTGFEIGYALPLGSAFLIDVGASMYQGSAKVGFIQDHVGTSAGNVPATDIGKDVSFSMDNLTNVYIAPTVALSDTSSLYVKIALTEADVTVTGDITSPGNLSGTTWALGTRTVLESGIFIRTEAGYTDYNGLSAHGKGTNIGTDNTYSAEPTVAFGAVSLGFRF